MCAQRLVKNIFQFVTILNQASSDDVKEWDMVSVQNALNWAEYLHKVYQNVINHPCKRDLEQQLLRMTLMLSPASCLTFTIESLGQAKVLLLEALLSNPSISSEVRCHLLQHTKGEDGLLVKKVQSNLKKSEGALKVSQELLMLLEKNVPTASREESHYRRVKGQSEILALRLVHVGQHTDKPDKFQAYCYRIFDTIADSGHLDILVGLMTLSLPVNVSQSDVMSSIVKYTVFWLKRTFTNGSCSLSVMSAKILAEAGYACEDFLPVYLDALTAWANNFQPCVHAQSAWRSADGSSLQGLCDYFGRLLLCPGAPSSGRETVLNHITSRVDPTDFSIWTPLSKCLLQVVTKEPSEWEL